MRSTLVIQSHRSPLPYAWLARCLTSVKQWSHNICADYRFLGNEIFETLPTDLRLKTQGQTVVASDLSRLNLIDRALQEGYETVLWLDADFLIFNPVGFKLNSSDYAVGREVWIQRDQRQRLRAYTKVHNAFLMFRQGNHFLDFYRHSAMQLLRAHRGPVVPQFIGPKLLTAIHNIVACPVAEVAGMISPLTARDIEVSEGPARDLFLRKSPVPIAGANLCSSLTNQDAMQASSMHRVIDVLLKRGSV